MSRFGDLLEILTVKRTDLIGKAATIVSVFFEAPEKDAEDESGVTAEEISEPAEWWQHYGFASRPPEGAESMVLRAGATVASIASRALAAADAYGKLGKGDSCLYSVGKNTIRLAASGAISMLVPSHGQQIVFRIDPKGSFKVLLANGFYMELSEENGFAVATPGKDQSFNGRNFQFVGVALNNDCAVLKTNKMAGVPLTTGPVSKANPGLLI